MCVELHSFIDVPPFRCSHRKKTALLHFGAWLFSVNWCLGDLLLYPDLDLLLVCLGPLYQLDLVGLPFYALRSVVTAGTH